MISIGPAGAFSSAKPARNPRIRAGEKYFFRKSGNLVRAIEETDYSGTGNWVVERISGASRGKRMIVHESALAITLD